MAKALSGKTGQVVIVRGDPGGTDNLNRASAFKTELAKVAPNLTIVADQDSSFGDEKKPYDVTTAMLAAHPNIIGIFTEADSIGNAAVKAVKDANLTGKVTVIGVGGSCEGFADVKAGTMYSTTYQDPPLGAADVFQATMDLINHKTVEKVKYMDLPVITTDNVSQYTCHW
jgi:ABC-type sugar transport system substrate-binding protein